MLYKVTETGGRSVFVPLRPTSMSEQGLLERQMEQWLADNPSAVLPEGEKRVLVISQEAPFQNVTDILAIDQRGNLVVIEVKRGLTPRDVVAQALEYASDVADWGYDDLNRRAIAYFARRNLTYNSLLEAFLSIFEVAPGSFAESDFNKIQRIFIIGEQVDEKVERAARWLLQRGVEISCLSYTCYVSEGEERQIFLDLEEVVRPEERQGSVRTRGGSGEQEPVREGDLPEPIQGVYRQLRERVVRFGSDVQFGATRNGLVFRANRNFAEIQLRRNPLSLLFNIRLDSSGIAEGQSAQVHGITVTRVPDSHGWALSYRFRIDQSGDLNAVEQLLRQSYDAVRSRA